MGNALGTGQPTNKTGKKVVVQKLENAKKTGVLSLSEHDMKECPPQVFDISNIRTLDLSNNQLSYLDVKIANLKQLKSLNLEGNKLTPGSINALSKLSNLQTLSLGMNMLGKPVTTTTAAAATGGAILGLPSPSAGTATTNKNSFQPLPSPLSEKLKTVKLNANYLSFVPAPIFTLLKLEKLDLSQNQLASVPVEIANLKNLTELVLDDNSIVSLPSAMGLLQKLKVLSLKRNHISVHGNTQWSEKNPQPLPKELFTDTPLIDLNLHQNPMTSTQLNSMEGYQQFLERRKDVKTNALLGGALTNLDVCGLE